ncbi:MAG: TraB/GumN family protein [Chitinophagales bacterium]|nr:TraB/GumN family protein [Chitinophagales bacterium]
MERLIIIIGFLYFSVGAYSQQKLEIAIIGTAHHFQEEHLHLQQFEKAQQYITNFKPDMFCIEAIPAYDTLSLYEVFPGVMKKANHLRDTLNQLGVYPVPSDPGKVETVCTNHPGLFPSVTVLKGAEYYANYDIWNAYYLWDKAIQSGDSLGYFVKYMRALESSEFRHIIFPAARQLGIAKFYGIDYRQGEKFFLEKNQQVMKQLLFRFKWKPLRIYLKTQKEYKKAEEQGRLLDYINAAEFQQAFSKLIEELPQRLPRSEEARQIQAYWQDRNQLMAKRLVEQAEQQKAQKIVLAVGSAHVTSIKFFLEADGHQVSTYGSITGN